MKTILVGVDGSPESLEAVEWTADLARSLDAEVVVASVYGFHPPMVMPAAGYYMTDEVLTEWRDELQRDLDGDWTKALRDAGVKVTTVVEEGHVPEVLLGLAKQKAVDLIVVGSRGHGGAAEMFLGSVSHNMVLRASCPVVVLPHKWHVEKKAREATSQSATVPN